MPKKMKIHPDDLQVFYDAVQGARPLKQDKVRLDPILRSKKSIKKQIVDEFPSSASYEKSDLNPVLSETQIAYFKPGINHKTFRKLRKGQYNLDAMLDLHGMSVKQALLAVERFLQTCLINGCQMVLIIHGKGRPGQVPILKNKVNHWLRHMNSVLAFCSASSSHGSRGAVYVLLRRAGDADFG